MLFKIISPSKLIGFIGLPLLVLSSFIYVLLKPNKILYPTQKLTTNSEIQQPISISNIEPKKDIRDSIINYSKTLLGIPYVSAACGKNGFDCSGFVFYVFQQFGIAVPRSSSEFKDFGSTVSIENAKIGDVLVFLSPTRNAIGHVGIITLANGMESQFIHATSGGEMKVIISSLKQEGYKKRFVKVVDVMPSP